MRRLSQLHERTRRWVGLSAFLVLCLVPTVGMLTWGVSRQLPIEKSTMEERLSQLLGLTVTIASVEHPEPGVLRLRDVIFERPGLKVVEESGTTDKKEDGVKIKKAKAGKSTPIVARLAELVVDRRQEPGTGRVCETVSMTGASLDIDQDELEELVRLFREAVDHRLGMAPVNLRFAFDRVRLMGELDRSEPAFSEFLLQEHRPQAELSSVLCQLLTVEECRALGLKDGPRAVVDFRLIDADGQESREPMRLQVGRRLNGRIWFGINSSLETIPCRLLGRLIPDFNSLGPEAGFCGSFWAESTSDGWEGELPEKSPKRPEAVTKFLNVDLESLIGRRFSQTIRGRVDVTIKEGVFASGRIRSLRGSVESREPGEIGQPLLAAAVREFGWKVESLYTTGPVTSYEGLYAHFAVEPRGILIQGGIPASGQYVLLRHKNRAILWNHPQWLDISALLRTLAPEAQAHIPAVESVEHLARRLPAKTK